MERNTENSLNYKKNDEIIVNDFLITKDNNFFLNEDLKEKLCTVPNKVQCLVRLFCSRSA